MGQSLPKHGDLIGLFSDKNFQLAVFLGEEGTKYQSYALVIFDYARSTKRELLDSNIETIRSLLRGSNQYNDLTSLNSFELNKTKEILESKLEFIKSIEEKILKNGIDISKLNEGAYIETYHRLNIYCTDLRDQKELRNDLLENSLSNFLSTLRKNVETIKLLQNGDIVKMVGLRTNNNNTIYHHHVILSDKETFKIVHKWGEPDVLGIISNLIAAPLTRTKLAEVREDSIIEVAPFREISKETEFEQIYKDFIRKKLPFTKIIEKAKARLGETTYDIAKNNCQHFCTSCCYDLVEGYERGISVEFDSIRRKTEAIIESSFFVSTSNGRVDVFNHFGNITGAFFTDVARNMNQNNELIRKVNNLFKR